jgi:hypothetical protein
MAIKLLKFHDPFDTIEDKKISIEFARKPPLTPKKYRHNLIVAAHKKSTTSIKKMPSTQN